MVTDDCGACLSHAPRRLHVDSIRGQLASMDELIALAAMFKLLGDPTRVRILEALAHAELCVCELTAVLGLTQSAVSHQLRLLRAAKLVRYRREGKNAFYSLDDEHVSILFQQGLEHIREPV